MTKSIQLHFFFGKINFNSKCVWGAVWVICAGVCRLVSAGAHTGQKRALTPLGSLELQVVVSCLWVLGTELGSSVGT